MAIASYSYVSLFGLNSLEDLRFAIFERTVTQEKVSTGADADTFGALLAKSGNLGRKARPVLDVILSSSKGQGLATALYRSSFLFVRDQLVCLDDLERAGPNLNVRDVLGLASFLKEERRCKVVLLLNDERLGHQTSEFADQIEKVADITMLFAPSPDEAAAIGVDGDDNISQLLRERSISLGITNIRVIAKTARLARQLAADLESYDAKVIHQAITTLVLASWAVQQPSEAPPLSFIREFSEIGFQMRSQTQPDADQVRWRGMIKDYPFAHADGLDLVVINGAAAGFFENAALEAAAAEAEEQMRQSSRGSEYSKVWQEMYHGSLATNDDDFLNALRQAATKEAAWITPLNMNSAIRVLRENGREDEANTLVSDYIEARKDERNEFFEIDRHHFRGIIVATLFFDRAAGRVHNAFSRSNSDQFNAATSWRRCPVIISSWNRGPNGAAVSQAARQANESSLSFSTRSRD